MKIEKEYSKEKFSCQRNELTIRGHVWGRGAAPKPAVILSHGFLANEKMCHTYAKLLAELGYVTFTFDFCGGGLGSRSDGKSENMTLLTEKADLLAVIDYVKKCPYVDSAHISLLGCSQGGFVSALAAKELQDDIENLLLFYPALCIPDDARQGKMLFFQFDPADIPDILGRFPMKLGGEYARCVIHMNPFEEIAGYNGRTLYLHGTADEIVDISYARTAKALYPNCRYEEIENGGHMFRGKQDKAACDILKEFMALLHT